jgi:PKD repeat protein
MAGWCRDAHQTTGSTVPFNAWTHVAVTYDGGTTISFYINGQFVQKSTLTGELNTKSGPLRIACTDNPGRNFNGKIDEVAIFSGALTQEQINTRFESYTPPEEAPETKLVAHWPMNEGSPSTSIADVSGNGNTGTINGATWIGIGANKALSFDGSGDYVDCGNDASLNITDSITIEAWVKTTEGNGYIVSKRVAESDHTNYKFRIYNNYLYFVYYNGTSHIGIADNSFALNDGNWHYVAVSYDRQYVRLYVDGIEVKNEAHTETLITNTAPVLIGKQPNTGWEAYFNGNIDEVRIYNGALTQAEINQHMVENPHAVEGDTDPPGNIIFNDPLPSDRQIALSWTNPGDADFDGLIILINDGGITGGDPINGTDYTVGDFIGTGEVVYKGTKTSTSVTLAGLADDTQYYFKAFTFDEIPNYSSGADVSAKTNPPNGIEHPLKDEGIVTNPGSYSWNYEAGWKFKPNHNGTVSELGFWGTGNGDTKTCNLWTDNGTLLASVNVTDSETGFSYASISDVSIIAGTYYRVSVSTDGYEFYTQSIVTPLNLDCITISGCCHGSNGSFPSNSSSGYLYGIPDIGFSMEEVNISPTATASASPTTGDAPLTVSLIGNNSYDTDGSIIKYEWDFNGDGAYEWSSTTGNTSHTYNSAGTFIAKLRVTDNDLATGTDDVSISVTNVTPPPTAYIDNISQNPAVYPASISFSGHGSGGTITDYCWKLNDGIYCVSTGSSFTLTQLTPGTYTVRFKVKNSDGIWSAEDTETLTINTEAQTVSLANATDNSFTWYTGGDNEGWIGQENVSHDGYDAAKSGYTPNNGTSYMETTVEGPGTLTFWWKASSESGCDYLDFFIDDDFKTDIEGNTNWSDESFVVGAGTHTFTWEYNKDGNVFSGSDCGWVDQITFTPGNPDCYYNDVELYIRFDDAAYETSWDIKNSSGTVIHSGGDYSTETEITETFTLGAGDYTFTIYDDYGEGICCDYGNGEYSLTDGYGDEIASGGAFYYEQSTDFCISGSKSVALSNKGEDKFGLEMLKVYPNPMTNEVSIDYSVQSEGTVTIDVYDITGKLVRTLTSEYKLPGVHTVKWNANDTNGTDMPNGTYFIRMQTGDNIQTTKVILMR